MTATNKGYSYPRVTVIRIDVHPTGENPTNMPHTFHTRSAYDPWPYVSHVLRVKQLFVSHQQIWTDHTALEKQGFLTTSLAHWMADLWVPTQFLSPHSQWSSRLKSNFCRWQATRFIESITPVCDWYIQYLLMGANPSVLNRHRRGL
jgi:hypothetical protein